MALPIDIPTLMLTVEWILIGWIMIATVKGLKKVAPVANIKQLELMKGVWKLETALGLALCGLAGLGSIATLMYPYSLGLIMLVITLGVFVLVYKANKDLEKVPLIASYSKKIEDWFEKRKKG